MTDAVETWVPIPGFPHYAASSLGRVKRVAATARYRATDKCLNSKPSARGYVTCSLYRDGKAHPRALHAIICEAFHGPRPSPKHHAAHWDGDLSNNRQENLRWATPAENSADKNRHGTMARGVTHFSRTKPHRVARGERNGRAKLQPADVLEIRQDERLFRQIAEEYGVSKSLIAAIKRREVWAHIRDEGN